MAPGILLLIAAAGIAAIIFLVIVGRLQAFVALLLVSLLVAIAGGIPPGEIADVVEEGMGGVLGFVAVVVGLGTIIGQLVQTSGGGAEVARRLIDRFGEDRAPWALGITGFLIAIPVFFDVGLIILIPLVYGLAQRTGRSTLYYAVPLLAGLALTHAFIPPTPGPVIIASLIGADLGWIILFGAIAGVPALIGGVVYSRFIARRIDLPVPEYMIEETSASEDEQQAQEDHDPPGIGVVLLVIGLPLGLILLNTLSEAVLEEGTQLAGVLAFIGHPFTALTVATLLAMYFLGIARGHTRAEVQDIATRSMRPVGMIILVTGAGGVFGEVLVQTGVGEALTNLLEGTGLPIIVLAFLIAVGVRVSLGSATVSMVTAASVAGPLVADANLSAPGLALVAIAIASGGTVLSHVNDSGFWLVNRYLGMSEKQTFQVWTAMLTIVGMCGFLVALVFSLFV